ncbi:ACP S-malonyltransferase [Pseudomonas fluorescens]|uniref:ACP S-malonyltransferase n=1 Tax=Pseudomonas fluorescens TaxID=294 RepID=UPI001ADC01F4|nr:ACP S-malonyltransferase [Pseudomonas fluorescens]
MSIVFMFSGQGSQYRHMGRVLYERHAGFARHMQALDDVVRQTGGYSVLERLYADQPQATALDDILVTHPAIFMVEYALAQTLIEHGVYPDHVLGSSLGEVAAAAVSGALDVEQAMSFVVRQARLFHEHCPAGGMTVMLADVALFEQLQADGIDVELAAINCPEHLVISGAVPALAAAEAQLARLNVVFQRLDVNRPFHSSHMDPLRDAFLQTSQALPLRRPRMGYVSSTFGGPIDQFPPNYLWHVVRSRLQLAPAIHYLERLGAHEYLDVGPSGSMANFAKRCRDADSTSTDTLILSPFDTSARSFERRITSSAQRTVSAEIMAMKQSNRAYMFPGQGSQFRGMGEGLFERFAELTACADRVLGYSIRELCENDPRNELGQTRFTQPALYVVNVLSYLDQTADAAPPAYVLGHSLGEFCALFAAGAYDFETGLRLVKRRGELMSEATEGGMSAVLNLDRAAIEKVLREAACTQLDFANFNAPQQTVLAGPLDELERVRPLLEDASGLCVALNVSAPFHSRYMRHAREAFAAELARVTFKPLTLPVIANVDARPYEQDAIASQLARQMTSSVQWVESIDYLLRAGITQFKEIGPGHVLSSLQAKIEKNRPAVQSVVAPVAVAPQPGVMRHDDGASLALTAEGLGSAAFRQAYGLRYAYMAGGMYKGIASVELVVRLVNAGYLAFFGAGGLSTAAVEQAIVEIAQLTQQRTFGMNLVCNLSNPHKEIELVELFMRKGVTVIEAAAFMQITPALALYRLRGLAKVGDRVEARHRIVAKVSRPEVAQQFLDPAPARVVEKLLAQGLVTPEQAQWAQTVPMADDLVVEADSGGHTDMGVTVVLLPTIIRLRDSLCQAAGYTEPVRVGAAGGIGSPESVAAAFMLGADFVVTGSINQCTPQAGTSDVVKTLLQDINVQDTEYAPAGDMFELGARVQVLKRGVFFPARANKLYDLWRRHDSLDELDEKTARQIQDSFFKRTFEDVFEETRAYYAKVAPQEIEKALSNPKHKMALVFRWYFIHSTRLAMTGSEAQRVDYQVHCGPSMGAFNQWVKGTDLEDWRSRHVDVVADRLMNAAAAYLNTRFHAMLMPGRGPVAVERPAQGATPLRVAGSVRA